MAKTFKQAFDRIEEVFEGNTVTYQQRFVIKMGTEIAKSTPVDTGAATANWQGSINAPDLNPTSKLDKSYAASPTGKDIKKSVSSSKFGDTLYLSNGVGNDKEDGGYIVKLENGHSKRQAPQGMVKINLARSKVISKRALK